MYYKNCCSKTTKRRVREANAVEWRRSPSLRRLGSARSETPEFQRRNEERATAERRALLFYVAHTNHQVWSTLYCWGATAELWYTTKGTLELSQGGLVRPTLIFSQLESVKWTLLKPKLAIQRHLISDPQIGNPCRVAKRASPRQQQRL